MTDTTIEAPLTEQQATKLVTEWESKLAAAQRDLAAHEARIGDAALNGNARTAATELHRLEVDVRIASQALEAAQRQLSKAKDNRYMEMLHNAQKSFEELEQTILADEAYLTEWKHIIDKAEECRQRIAYNARRQMNVEANIMDLKGRIQDQKRKKEATNAQ
jgi:hypothetical protein